MEIISILISTIITAIGGYMLYEQYQEQTRRYVKKRRDKNTIKGNL
jgi:putative Mn2+ efflux pump MntP